MLSPSSGNTVIKSKLIGRRMFLLTAAKAIVTFGIIGRLVSLQINERTKYKTLSDKNRFREWKFSPPRGTINDYYGKQIASNKQVYQLHIIPENSENIARVLKLNKDQTNQFIPMIENLLRLFVEKDLSLLEINPLVITENGDLHCLDAKINIDSNALYRQPDLAEMYDQSQEDPQEAEAAKNDLSYVSLDGNIGCMVNGAGLAMGTMDTIKFYGGNPANFLDVGGTATQQRVAKAFKIILDDPDVKVVLVNIFGGIVRCDLIAEGIISAIKEVDVKIPVVVRLEGNNAKKGSQILSKASIKIDSINNLADAAKKAVDFAK